MEYDNTNRGVLFKNDRKEDEKQPDYQGRIDVNGVEFWLSAWIKEGVKGKFMSLSVKPKEQRQEKPRADGNKVAQAAYGRHREAPDDLDNSPF